MSAKNTTFAADFDKKLADNELYIRFTICSTVWRLLLNQVVLIPKKVDSITEIVDLSISQQNHPITLKTPKTFPLKICTCANFVVPLQREPALEGVCPAKSVSQKILRNGQLIIIRNGVEYNAAGQEM